jgi:hypothetical protein
MDKDLAQSTSSLPVSVTEQILRTHMHLIATVISRTSGMPGTFTQSSAFSGIGKHWEKTYFRFVLGLQWLFVREKLQWGKF